MSQEMSDPDAWENGCQRDAVRNDFIVPALVGIFMQERSQRILDVGTGTGFVPRAVNSRLDYRPEWTLIDVDQQRLKLAQSLCPQEMHMDAHCIDITQPSSIDGPFEASLLTFTLLESSDCELIIECTTALTAAGGLLIIALPDVWRDVLTGPASSLSNARTLLEGRVDIAKIDKFTRQPYPFHARRIEEVIHFVLEQGFSLERLERGGPQSEAILVVFRKHQDCVSKGASGA